MICKCKGSKWITLCVTCVGDLQGRSTSNGKFCNVFKCLLTLLCIINTRCCLKWPTYQCSHYTVFLFLCYTVSGETPEQRLENVLTTMNQQRTAKYGGMTSWQFQAAQEKRKQLWKKRKLVTHTCYVGILYVYWSLLLTCVYRFI